MKKLITLILGITLAYSCSTSSDGNGNTNTTVVPIAPSSLTVTATSTSQITLTWTDNSTNETGFKIERKTGTDSFAVVGTTATDIATFSDTGLIPSTVYTYRVYSYNSAGNSPYYSYEIMLITNSINSSITIGSQTWKTKNLDVNAYSDGTPIPEVTDDTQWRNLTTGAWRYINNDPGNNAVYGKLYNWYAAVGIYDSASLSNPAIRKKLAPTGWHVPTDTEWNTLIINLDPNADGISNNNVVGGKLKSTGTIDAGTGLWKSPNIAATNSSGFLGLPAGYTSGFTFTDDIGGYSYWWSSSEYNTYEAWNHNLIYLFEYVNRSYCSKYYGLSVRCVKD